MKGIVGRKLGMTQVFDEETGSLTPVTVIQAGPCPVVAVRTVTTGQGPGSITVTASTFPVSGSKIWVMPSFLPRMPLIAVTA